MSAKITEVIKDYCFNDDLLIPPSFMKSFNKKLREEQGKKTCESLSTTPAIINYDVHADKPTLSSGGLLSLPESKNSKPATLLSRSVIIIATKAGAVAGAEYGTHPDSAVNQRSVKVDAVASIITHNSAKDNSQASNAGHAVNKPSHLLPTAASVQPGVAREVSLSGRPVTASVADASVTPVTRPGAEKNAKSTQPAVAGHTAVSSAHPQSVPQHRLTQGEAGSKAPMLTRHAAVLQAFTASMHDESANKSAILLNRVTAVASVNTARANANPAVTLQLGKAMPETVTAPAAAERRLMARSMKPATASVNERWAPDMHTAHETTPIDNRHAQRHDSATGAVSTGEPKSARDKASLWHSLSEAKPDETISQSGSLSFPRESVPGAESSRAANPSRAPLMQRDVTAPHSVTENSTLELNYKFQRWAGDHSVRVSLSAEDRGKGSLLLRPSGSRVVDALSNQFDQLTSHTPKLVEAICDGDERQQRQQRDNQDEEAE